MPQLVWFGKQVQQVRLQTGLSDWRAPGVCVVCVVCFVCVVCVMCLSSVGDVCGCGALAKGYN